MDIRQKFIAIGLPVLLFALGIGVGYSLGKVNANDIVNRQRIIHDRYPVVYPFDIGTVKHVFHEHYDGGAMEIHTEATSTEQVALIQSYMKIQYDRFRTGNFSDEAELHGVNMPGITDISENYMKINFSYNNLPNGAQIKFSTDKPELIEAIHLWFRAQLLDHGDDAISHMGEGEM